MGTLANAANLASDAGFRNLALAALVTSARNVLVEDPATANHARRIWFANMVLRNPSAMLDSIAWTMANDPAINVATSPALVVEATLQNAVASSWNYLAGLTTVNL